MTFFGRAGVCAVGAVISKVMADSEMLDYYLTKFKEVPSIFNSAVVLLLITSNLHLIYLIDKHIFF